MTTVKMEAESLEYFEQTNTAHLKFSDGNRPLNIRGSFERASVNEEDQTITYFIMGKIIQWYVTVPLPEGETDD
jgi:hypothetical protein